MAFAMELFTSRNAKLRGVHASYPEMWSWDGGAAASGAALTHSRSDATTASIEPRFKAPLFVVSDYAHAVVYAMRSKTVLDGRLFMSSFRIGTIEALPRFRLDVMRHFEQTAPVGGDDIGGVAGGSGIRAHALRLSIENIDVTPSRTDLALEGVLVTIAGETLGELVKMEARLHPQCTQPETERSCAKTKGRRVEGGDGRRAQQASERRWQWADGNSPCGVRFHLVSVEDALEGRSNGLDVALREALASRREGVQPYRCLIEALCDVCYLVHQLHQLSPGVFLLALEQMVSAGTSTRDAPRGVGGTHGADARRALWTLSDKFSDVVVLSTERVFQLKGIPGLNDSALPQHARGTTTPGVMTVSDDDDDVVLLDDTPTKPPLAPTEPQRQTTHPSTPSSMMQYLAPPPDAPGQRLDLIKSLSLGWIGSMMRKLQRSQEDPRYHKIVALPPSLLILADNEAAMRHIAHVLVMPRDEYVRMELERFIALYRRFRGVAVTSRDRAMSKGGSRRVGDADGKATYDVESIVAVSSDDEDADEAPTEDVLAQRMTQSQQRPLSSLTMDGTTASSAMAGVVQELLLTQTLGDAAVLDDCDLLTRASTSLSDKSHQLLGGLTFVGMTEGSIVLEAGHKDSSVMVRIVNVTTISAHHLVAYYREGCRPNNCGDDDKQRRADGEAECAALHRLQWDRTASMVPPVGRIIVCSPTLRTMRLIESFEDLVNNASSSAQTRGGGVAIKVQLLTVTEGRAASSALRDRELSSERHYFHDLLIHKATMVQEAFADRDEQLATERLLQSGLQRRPTTADAPSRAAHDVGALMPMRLRLRAPRPGDRATTAPQSRVDSGDVQPLVVFDEREFRSSLPYQLYCRGFQVLPLTLLHGDYLIASNYALERKSLSDLTQSLMSGRLLAQLTAMSRQFAHPTLLIEFSRSTAFRMFPPRRVTSSMGGSDDDWTARREGIILRKLAGTLVANPRTHVLWCRSPQHAASLCHRIRTTFADASSDADPSDESLTQRKEGESAADSLYAMRVLRQFPGVDGENVSALMEAAGSLSGLALLSESVLQKTLGEEKGAVLHRFLHTKLAESV